MPEKFATGMKRRKIRANNISINSSFTFNRAITPIGGTDSGIFISKTKKGLGLVKLYQDLNDDGIVSRKELIYKGKSQDTLSGDELLNFNGDIKFTKTMHMCDWISAKHPNHYITCTEEYIPTVYALTMISSSGIKFEMNGIGRYASEVSY